MKLLIFNFAILFVIVIANPNNYVEDQDPIEFPADEVVEDPDENSFEIHSESSDKFQGDMILPPEVAAEIEGRSGRTGIKATKYRWPKSGGYVRVAYFIASSYTTAEKNIITSAMREIESKTCVRFSPTGVLANAIKIINGDGCWSYVGKQGGLQELSLKRSGCITKRIVMHELIHALGFGHQHSHYQRDTKVTIQWNNIKTGQKYNFDKLPSSLYDNYGTSYDYDSIMHYRDNEFAKTGTKTIIAKNSFYQNRMGRLLSLSAGDITRIKKMYNC